MSLVSSSLNAPGYLTTYNVSTAHSKNETSSQAIDIGNLDEGSSIVTVSDTGAAATNALSTTFAAQAGDNATLSEDFTSAFNQIETQFQLYDGDNNLIADSGGTPAQQQAYADWENGDLTLTSSGTYTAIATPEVTDGSSELSLSSSATQGTALGVTSQLTGNDSSEYYNFSLSGKNLKLDFDAGASSALTRVQVYDTSGNLIADSQGNAYTKANYLSLTSNLGLSASSGDYSVEVSYAQNVDTTPSINYNFNLYSGTNYSVFYNNKVTAHATDNSAAGSVTASSTAKSYARSSFNKIGATAASAVNIGWLSQNKTSLNVISQLTGADNADYYSLTLQKGDNLKFGLNNSGTQNSALLRVQLYDSTGSRLLADSEGTPAQQQAYQNLTTTNGLSTKPATYVAKISYAKNAKPTKTQYSFSFYSGTTYTAQYKTTASSQTSGNALLNGNLNGGSSAKLAAATYLRNMSNGGSADISGALQSSI